MKVPEEAEKYIRLQRTNLQRESSDVSVKKFTEEMEQEYKLLASYLPPSLHCVLDIGCGVGGIDIPIYHNHGKPILALLDSTGIPLNGIHYSFHNKGEVYNSMNVTRKMMDDNDVSGYLILDSDNYDIIGLHVFTIDLVISLLAWGFHFSVQIYCEKVYSLLSLNGIVILDVRKGTNGIETLNQFFSSIEVIFSKPKYDRIVARSPRGKT